MIDGKDVNVVGKRHIGYKPGDICEASNSFVKPMDELTLAEQHHARSACYRGGTKRRGAHVLSAWDCHICGLSITDAKTTRG